MGASLAYIGAMKPAHLTKLITCGYCGARSTLPVAAKRQALVCHGCGAPIETIEILQPALEKRKKSKKRRKTAKPAQPHPACDASTYRAKDHPARRKKAKPKKRRSLFRGLGDVFEDVFDDVFDDLEDLLDVFD